ncbi:Uma2 family endonuclease [Streptacidiphilus sp. MAP12-20]|uniref:Uma2 family endonuclease n=1 Tax=Streptacidiphilus sp. MAP12-20 TaxID=3156299 RepID=UPI003519B3EA
MAIPGGVFTYEELLGILARLEIPPGFKSELLHGEIVLSPQGDEEHSDIILAAREAARAAGLPRWRSLSNVLTPFPERLNGFCPDVSLLRRSAQRGARPRPAADLAGVVEVVSGDRGATDYGVKVEEYAQAGIDAYLIADPLRGTCKLCTSPVDGIYTAVDDLAFGDVIRFVADETEFVLDTSDWPRIS